MYEEDLQFKQLFIATLDSNKKPKKQTIKDNIFSISFSPIDNKLLVKLQPSPLIDEIYMKSLWQIKLIYFFMFNFKNQNNSKY